ncbi:MAG: hypothetical protein ACFNYB_08030 [Campylobacter sp.]
MRKIARLAGVKRCKYAPRAIDQDFIIVTISQIYPPCGKARSSSVDTAFAVREMWWQTAQNVLKCKQILIHPLNLT